MFPYATFFISFLLICSSICVNAQSEREVSDQIDVLSLEFIQQNPEHALAKINRLLTQVSNDNSLQNITALLQKKADVFLHTLESEQGVHVLDSALLLARKYDLAIDRSKIYSRKSTFLARLGKVDETFTTLDSVLLYINESPPDDRGGYLAQTYYLRARLQDRSGQLEAAMESYLKALEVAKATGSTAKIMDVYLQLGYVHKALNNLPQAIKSHQQSLQYSRQLADTTYQIYNYVFLAGAYLKTAKFDSIASKQKEYLQQAFQYLQTANSLAAEGNQPNELELLYFEYSNYYEARKDYRKAITYILKSRALSKSVQNLETIMASHSQAADCYFKLGQYEEAIKEAKIGIELANEIGAYYYLAELNKAIADATEKQGNTKLAFQYYKKYVTIKDSIFKAETAQQVNELQAKYETIEKEQEIEKLNSEKERQATALRNSYYFIALVIVIATLFSVLIWIFLRQKNLVNQFEKQQAQLRWRRAQLNPHFFFNVLSALQTLIYERKNKQAIQYVSGFSKLMRNVLEESNRDKITLEEEITFIDNYLQLEQLSLKFTYNISIRPDDLEVEDILLPTMLLQPFIENAIEHGLKKSTRVNKKLNILIIELNPQCLQISIKDNGAGRSESQRKNHISRAMEITADRRKLLQGRFNYEIVDHKDENDLSLGTEVIFTINI